MTKTNSIHNFVTLIDTEDTRFSTRYTYAMSDTRRIEVTVSKNGSDMYAVKANAYIYEPHDEIWYDCNGDERSKRVDWLSVGYVSSMPKNQVDNVIAMMYGVLICTS